MGNKEKRRNQSTCHVNLHDIDTEPPPPLQGEHRYARIRLAGFRLRGFPEKWALPLFFYV